MEVWRLQLAVAVLWAYEQLWNAEAGWQFRSVSVAGHSSDLTLIETLRLGTCSGQELLTISPSRAPPAELTSDHWTLHTPWADLEGWALQKTYHSLAVPAQDQDL